MYFSVFLRNVFFRLCVWIFNDLFNLCGFSVDGSGFK